MAEKPALVASEAPPRVKPSNYPEPFATRMSGRVKHPLGDLFGLRSFGVNLTRLHPGSVSALHHRHSRQDEFIYVLEGEPTLFTGDEVTQLRPGMVAGFPAAGVAHHLENRTGRDCVILEVGDRAQDDEVHYPSDDIQAVMGEDGRWCFTHKDGVPY
ncbi:cupin domain-containing protein [Roseomonas elaeocarpi]|uniref:Cupin domain-containing protein n=1 Tax=Roseomonas elaeocarpi TaxID=907779 RepID=A0ABV6JUC8_9PROT